MRTFIPAIAILLIAGCSSTPTVKEQPTSAPNVITTIENTAVVYDRASISEVELDDNATNLPKLVSKVEPYYPEMAQRAGIQGNVYVHTLIAPSGEVRMAKVLTSDAEILNRPSLEAVLKWKFEPPMADGKSAAVWVKIPFRFAISK